MDFNILYDKNNRVLAENGKNAFSDILYIPSGKVALVSIYNMISSLDIVKDKATGRHSLQSNDCAVVHKISFSRTDPLVKKFMCGEKINIDMELRSLLLSRRMRHEPVYQCFDAWMISACSNIVVITVPGFYMLEFFDADQFDSIYVEYAIIDASDSLAIPDSIKIGGK